MTQQQRLAISKLDNIIIILLQQQLLDPFSHDCHLPCLTVVET